MNTTNHPARLVPLVGRTPGGAVEPEPAGENDLLAPLTKGGEATVGVVDTGVSLDESGQPHPWFSHHLSYCPEDDQDVPAARAEGYPRRLSGVGDGSGAAEGHGTFVAGLILAQAPSARIRMWGVLDEQRERPAGLEPADDRLVAAAVHALAINPRVLAINLSFGGGVFGEADEPALLKAALADIDLDRVAVVAAAGNEGGSALSWPAAFEGVIAVGALDTTAHSAGGEPPIAEFSTRGDWVSVYAAGVGVLGPYLYRARLGASRPVGNRHGWARWSGTSFAAATVSGRIAALAIDRGITGAQAARALVAEAPRLETAGGKPWIS